MRIPLIVGTVGEAIARIAADRARDWVEAMVLADYSAGQDQVFVRRHWPYGTAA